MHAMKSETFYNHPSGNDYHETKAIDMLKKEVQEENYLTHRFRYCLKLLRGWGEMKINSVGPII